MNTNNLPEEIKDAMFEWEDGTWSFECNECENNESPPRRTIEFLILAAIRDGWCIGGCAVWCPECAWKLQ